MAAEKIVFNGRTYYKIKSQGYWRSFTENLHQAIWRHHIGPIPAGCHIHHLDHNKDNNNIDNLACMPGGEHERQHAKEMFAGKSKEERLALMKQLAPKPRQAICEECGKGFISKAAKGVKRWCSMACYLRFRYRTGVCNVEKTCPVCHKKFTVNKYSKQITCGRLCGSVYSHRETANAYPG